MVMHGKLTSCLCHPTSFLSLWLNRRHSGTGHGGQALDQSYSRRASNGILFLSNMAHVIRKWLAEIFLWSRYSLKCNLQFFSS